MGPRRFKALFRGEVSPNVGRGSPRLPRSLLGRRDARLAGLGPAGRGADGPGRSVGTGGDAGELFPGRLAACDVLAALLGVPEELPAGEGAVVRGGRVELRLPSGDGRAVLVSPSGEVTGLVLPAGVRVELSPGAGVPRRIELSGPEGRAILTLESYGPWPEGEEAPKG